MSTEILMIPEMTMEAGKIYGPFSTGPIAGNYSKYRLEITPTNFPASGDKDVLQLVIEMSTNSGETWQFDASCAFGPFPWKDKTGKPIKTAIWDIAIGTMHENDIPIVLMTEETDLYRITINVFQSCSTIITLHGVV